MGFLFLFISIIYSIVFLLFDLLIDGKYDFFNRINNNLNNDNIFNLLTLGQNENTFYSFFGNIQFENIIFLIIGFLLFFYFSSIKIIEYKKNNMIEKEKIDIKNIILNFFNKFGKFSYYIGLILFYFSIYLISTTQDFIKFSQIILGFLIIIYLYYFISKKSKFSGDLLRINSLLFSSYYVFNYIYILYTNLNTFDSIDFYNGFLVIFIFPVLLYNHSIFRKNKNINKNIIIHFVLYIFSFIFFYSKFYLNENDIFYWLCIIPIFFSFSLFEFFTRIQIFKIYKYIFRTLSLVFLYLGTFFGILYLSIVGINFLIYFTLIFSILFNYYVHKKFQNYLSFLMANITLLLIINIYIYKIGLIINYFDINYLLFNILYSFILIGITYIFKFKYIYDYYFLHIFSYIINIIGIFLYLSNSIDILYLGILLFIDSLYFFISYNKLTLLKINSHKKGLK